MGIDMSWRTNRLYVSIKNKNITKIKKLHKLYAVFVFWADKFLISVSKSLLFLKNVLFTECINYYILYVKVR